MRRNVTRLRRSEIPSGSGPRRTTYCEECGAATREGKRYCSEHVEKHPYVVQLLESLQAKDAEEELVKQRGDEAVQPYGLTSKEIVTLLRVRGALSIPRIARELRLEVPVAESYVNVLAKLGRVVVKKGTRSKMVSLVSRRRRRYF